MGRAGTTVDEESLIMDDFATIKKMISDGIGNPSDDLLGKLLTAVETLEEKVFAALNS